MAKEQPSDYIGEERSSSVRRSYAAYAALGPITEPSPLIRTRVGLACQPISCVQTGITVSSLCRRATMLVFNQRVKACPTISSVMEHPGFARNADSAIDHCHALNSLGQKHSQIINDE